MALSSASRKQQETAMASGNLLPNRSRTVQSSTQPQATVADQLPNTAEWRYNPQPSVLAWLSAIEPEYDTHYPTRFKLPLQPAIRVNMPRKPSSRLSLLGHELKPRVIRSVSIEILPQLSPSRKESMFSLATKPTSWLNLVKDDPKHPSSLQLYIKTSIEKIAFERGSSGLLQTIIWANLYKHDIEQTGFWEIVEAEALRRLPAGTDYFMRVRGNTEQFQIKLANAHLREDEFYVGIFGGEFLWMRYKEGREWSLRVLKQFA